VKRSESDPLVALGFTNLENDAYTYIVDDSPAVKAGFKPGDIITVINEIGVERLNGLLAVSDLVKAEPGTRYRFAGLRNGEIIHLPAELKELYEN